MVDMRPGQLHPNEFEIALLERIAADNPDAELSICDLHVLSREFTGVGCFVSFLIKGRPNTGARCVLDSDAAVTIPGLQCGLGVAAFLEGSTLTLETYTFGDEKWDGVFDGFTLLPKN